MESVRIEVADLKRELSRLREMIDSQENPNPATQASLTKAQKRLDILDAVSGDPQVTQQQAMIADLDRQLAELAVEQSQSTLSAPFDGTIAQRYVNEGTIVSPGLAVARLVESDSLEAWISIPTDVAQAAVPGEAYVIEVGQRDYDASVSSKLPELDRTTRTRTVVFSLEDADSGQLLPGEVARVELTREVESPGIWLPITALTGQAGHEAGGHVQISEPPGLERGGASQLLRRKLDELHVDAVLDAACGG